MCQPRTQRHGEEREGPPTRTPKLPHAHKRARNAEPCRWQAEAGRPRWAWKWSVHRTDPDPAEPPLAPWGPAPDPRPLLHHPVLRGGPVCTSGPPQAAPQLEPARPGSHPRPPPTEGALQRFVVPLFPPPSPVSAGSVCSAPASHLLPIRHPASELRHREAQPDARAGTAPSSSASVSGEVTRATLTDPQPPRLRRRQTPGGSSPSRAFPARPAWQLLATGGCSG